MQADDFGAHADPGVIVGYEAERGSGNRLVLGAGARLRTGSVLYRGSNIGTGFETGHNVIIREDCVIADDVSVWTNSVVDYGCQIGAGVKIHTGCYVAQFTVIQPGAFLAPGVNIANDLYPGNDESADVMTGPRIGAGAQVGAGATILPFVRIGAGSLIGSGAVVTNDVPPGMVAVGNPARVTKPVKELTPISERLALDGERFVLQPPSDDRTRATSKRRKAPK